MGFDMIHHVAIIGSDYEKSRHFYVDLLGFEVIRENYGLGIKTEPVRVDEFTNKKMTFFSDPDDLPLEIHE